jgi:hypothetical protein
MPFSTATVLQTSADHDHPACYRTAGAGPQAGRVGSINSAKRGWKRRGVRAACFDGVGRRRRTG